MITNKILRDTAFSITKAVVEERYKIDIEEIFENIRNAANIGKFYIRYYFKIEDDNLIHSLEYYMKACGYTCCSNYSYVKDKNGKVIYDDDYNPIKDKIWLDIWWCNK